MVGPTVNVTVIFEFSRESTLEKSTDLGGCVLYLLSLQVSTDEEENMNSFHI